MHVDEKRAADKHAEITSRMADALRPTCGAAAEEFARRTVGHFAEITAPRWEPPPIQLMTMSPGGLGGGSSTKPGNITLNLRQLVVAVASGTLTMVGATVAPWTLIFGALVTWDSLWSSLQVELGEAEASVAWALWKACDADHTVAKKEVITIVNKERGAFGKQKLSTQEIDFALGRLERMRCIQDAKSDPNRWWLREWVRVQYE
jgi:hypothetical protein